MSWLGWGAVERIWWPTRCPDTGPAGLTRGDWCSGLCPWRVIGPRSPLMLAQSTDPGAQPESREQGPRATGPVGMLLACGPVKADQAGSLQVQRREPARCTRSTVFVGCREEWRCMKEPIHPFTKWSLSQAHVLAGSKRPGTQAKGWAGRGYSPPGWRDRIHPCTSSQ